MQLYSKIPKPFSMGVSHLYLAQISSDIASQIDHVTKARELWSSINRPDLVEMLDSKFGHNSPS